MSTSTIPFDPSLVLGMVVDPGKIEQLKKIADLQLPVDLARNKMNALLRQKYSLDMTLRELISLGAGGAQLESFQTKVDGLMDNILEAAKDLGDKVVAAEASIAEVKSEQGQKQIGSQNQSPIDFSSSVLKDMPISSDSMSLDVQYFRYQENEEKTKSGANSISTFVGSTVSQFLGTKWGQKAGASANNTVSSASKNRSLLGTVVIVANCTHKKAKMYSPVKLNVDDAVDAYVASTQKAWSGNPLSPGDMVKIAMEPTNPDQVQDGMPLLVGATYGSSFVGFVHFEQIEKTTSAQNSQAIATKVAQSVKQGLFLASSEGTFSLDAQSAQSAKNLLSSSDVQSHCSVITMGLIPTIKSNNIQTVVEGLKGTPADHMKQLAAIQDSSNAGISSMASEAGNARKANSFEKMNTDYIKGSVDAVAEVDKQNNKVIDMNSMMTALDDYVKKASDADGGVPINFYLKYITPRVIAQQWLEKYYPAYLKGDLKEEES